VLIPGEQESSFEFLSVDAEAIEAKFAEPEIVQVD
jgi:hypothetical protein